MKEKAKKTAAAEKGGTVVYCGPTIPGVAKQFTNYTGGTLPKKLAEAVEKDPVMAGLVVPLEELPEAMKKLHGGYGHIYRLYQLVQAKL